MPVVSMPTPHSPGQKQVIVSGENDVIFAGRRYGKTEAGAQRIIRRAVMEPKSLFWWVAISHRSASAKRAWRLLQDFHREICIASKRSVQKNKNLTNYELKFPNGSEIWMRTAEKPESLAGEGINGAVVDEFTLMQERVWTEYLEGTLLDKRGWAMFIGVPKSINWGALLYRKALDRPGWNRHHFTSYDNPYVPKDRLDEMRDNTPERIFLQEYMAEIISAQGLVFSNVTECSTSTWLDQAEPGGHYIAGLDLGKLGDYSVISVFDANTRSQVYLDRFNQIDYMTQARRVKHICDLFNIQALVVEVNSIGEAVADSLIEMNLPVARFTTTASSKRDAVERLSMAFQNREISILPDETQVNELMSYEMVAASHGFKYGAPSGMHDDTVSALWLAWTELSYGMPFTI